MSLTLEEVKKIAHLARLNLSENDIALYTPQLSGILAFIEHMNQTDTSQTEALAHPLDISQRLRPDEIKEPNLQKDCGLWTFWKRRARVYMGKD